MGLPWSPRHRLGLPHTCTSGGYFSRTSAIHFWTRFLPFLSQELLLSAGCILQHWCYKMQITFWAGYAQNIPYLLGCLLVHPWLQLATRAATIDGWNPCVHDIFVHFISSLCWSTATPCWSSNHVLYVPAARNFVVPLIPPPLSCLAVTRHYRLVPRPECLSHQ